MARKVQQVTIDAEGRDKGKVFIIREMPATQAEKWAMRAFLALAKSGVDVPEDVASSGLAGIAALGLRALSGLTFTDAEPLMDEMFSCIQIMPDPTRPDVVRILLEDDIEEIATRLKLRKEVLALHTGFFSAAAR